jgi:hypothetical protein
MAWLACQQVEYVPEQLIRVPPMPEAPEITVFAVPAAGLALPGSRSERPF